MRLVLTAKVHFVGDTAVVTFDVDEREKLLALMALATTALDQLELAQQKAAFQELRENLSATASIRRKVPGGTDPAG